MNPSPSEAIIQQYLDRVAAHLSDLRAEERSEILNDLRAHIDEAIGETALASEVEVRNVLARLGDPADLAREARGRAGDDSTPSQPGGPERRPSGSPGVLEVAAIILTAIVWPIGVLLAWVSPRWLTRDKVVATIIPAISTLLLGFIIIGGLVAWGSGTSVQVSVNDEPAIAEPGSEADQRSPSNISDSSSNMSVISRLVVVLGFLGGVIAGPFVAAVYLAIRLQPVEVPAHTERENNQDAVPARGQA